MKVTTQLDELTLSPKQLALSRFGVSSTRTIAAQLLDDWMVEAEEWALAVLAAGVPASQVLHTEPKLLIEGTKATLKGHLDLKPEVFDRG